MYRKIRLNIPNLRDEYTIDTDGVVVNVTRNKTLAGTSISKNNRYVKIHLDKFYALHRLVATHFVDNPNGYTEINHIDGNRYNNSASNLEWVSHKDNMLHAYKTKLKSNHGELNPFRKLTADEARKIWAMRDLPLTARQIRDRLKLNVSVAAVKAVRIGKNWTSVTQSQCV